jgi:hypothetical protein
MLAYWKGVCMSHELNCTIINTIINHLAVADTEFDLGGGGGTCLETTTALKTVM